ncbi:MAG: transposase [Verrucomicrobiales bacterium]
MRGLSGEESLIYRSSRSWHSKRNFQVFTTSEFLVAAVEHIPPNNHQTVRYYGLYSTSGVEWMRKRPGLIQKCGQPHPPRRRPAAIINNAPRPPRTPHQKRSRPAAPLARSQGGSGARTRSSAPAARGRCRSPAP